MKITAAKEDDFPHIHDFLAPHEFFCTVLASKIRRREEGIFIVRTDSAKEDRIFGVFQLNGTLFHCFPDFTDFSTGNSGFCAAAEFCAEFMEFIKDKKIKCVSGEEKSSEFLMKLIEISGRKPYFRNSYILMTLKKMSVSDFPHILPDGARVVRAVSGDDRIIFGIQKNYLEEEVVPPGKVLSDFEVRISLRQILNSQIVLLVVKEKKVAAKLNTNAVGFEWIQLGGVYTEKEFRRSGYAFTLVSAISGRINGNGRGVCLFVKKDNIAAIRLYRKAEFSEKCGYLIAYY